MVFRDSRARIALVIVVCSLGIASACSSFSGRDIAGSADGGVLGDGGGGNAMEAGVTNLAVNGDFEQGCTAWTPVAASATDDLEARDGGHACRVCSDTDAGPYRLYQYVAGAELGATYEMRAWVRALTDAGVPTTTGTRIDVSGSKNQQVQQGTAVAGSGGVTADGWLQVSTTTLVQVDSGAQLVASLQANPVGTCFLVDDVIVFKH